MKGRGTSMNIKTYSGILFIGDVLASKSRPGRRIDEDYFETVFKKLSFALNHAEKNNLKPVIVGRLCRKKFEVTSYARLITELTGKNVTVLAGANEFIGASTTLNPHSQASLLAKSGVINLCSEPGVIERIHISDGHNTKSVALYGVPEKHPAPKSLGLQEGIMDGEEAILIRKGRNYDFENEDGVGEIEIDIQDWPGCSLFVSDNGPFQKGVTSSEKTKWLNTGPMVRTKIDEDGHEPFIWSYSIEGIEKVSIPHEKHIFDLEGLFSQATQKEYQSSEFTTMLKQATSRSTQDMPENFIVGEISQIYDERETGHEVREIIQSLIDFTSNPSSALDGIF